ncbi:hypothetical protein L596_005915 [Steinernema carpocapsae]|uniref:Uncharacterized protein n=1 Tax=Steinernema carpocapsae TaxID=34508 RepID=A0A4U8V0J3_STECR|nr:hypothetical protein L596_005915 [Steinernema carpocapsae]
MSARLSRQSQNLEERHFVARASPVFSVFAISAQSRERLPVRVDLEPDERAGILVYVGGSEGAGGGEVLGDPLLASDSSRLSSVVVKVFMSSWNFGGGLELRELLELQ